MATTSELNAIWNATHRDFRGVLDGVRTILVCRKGATVIVALADLTEAEVAARLPRAMRKAVA